MTNQNYLVKTTNKQYIVKFLWWRTEKLINRQDEKYNLELLKDLDLDVKIIFWYWSWYKVNEYIESAITLDSTSIKTKFDKIAPILQTIHASGKELRGEFAPLKEIKNTNPWLKRKSLMPTMKLFEKKSSPREKTGWLRCWQKILSYRFGAWKLYRITLKDDSYLIDWEYSSMNDPMWDLAALFLESEFTRQEEEDFISLWEWTNSRVSWKDCHL